MVVVDEVDGAMAGAAGDIAGAAGDMAGSVGAIAGLIGASVGPAAGVVVVVVVVVDEAAGAGVEPPQAARARAAIAAAAAKVNLDIWKIPPTDHVRLGLNMTVRAVSDSCRPCPKKTQVVERLRFIQADFVK